RPHRHRLRCASASPFPRSACWPIPPPPDRGRRRRGRRLRLAVGARPTARADRPPDALPRGAGRRAARRAAHGPRSSRPADAGGPPLRPPAYTPAGLDRVARRADGWTPAGLPVGAIAPMWSSVRDLAAGHGRDPDALSLVVRANVKVSGAAFGADRPSY